MGYLIRNTLVMNGVSIFQNIFVALVLAILLKEIRWKKGGKIVQTVTFFPYFVSWVISYAIVWSLLAVNSGENKKVVTQFLLDNGYTFPVALDADYAVSSLYPSDGIPYTVIFDTDGTVAHIQVGAGDAETMYAYYSQLIDELLK